MYKIMLAFGGLELLKEIQSLKIWQKNSDFEIADIVYDGITAYKKMKSNHYDLVITEIEIRGMSGLELLELAKKEKLCSHIVICSEMPNFEYARQGIVLGAFNYYIKPFEEKLFISDFYRIRSEKEKNESSESSYAERIIGFFESHNKDIYGYVEDMLDKIYAYDSDSTKADKTGMQICSDIYDGLFAKNEWLDLYVNKKNFYGDIKGKKAYREVIFELFDEFCGLFPNVENDKIQEVILYILNYPEDNLKQKNIAEKLCINKSYLSTVFMAHTGVRFVDYLTRVKLSRTAFLLKNTDMKIIDIASRLDYKDIGYFSRLFKKQYRMTPSEYRIPDNYTYQI